MKTGNYLNDALRMVGYAAPLLHNKMDDDAVIQSFQFFSNGLEKLLKHGLERINPLFIQDRPEFKHSAALYRDKFVLGYKGAEVDKEPNQDVITFRASLNRLQVFSQAANKNRQLLHAVINWRDILAHRPSEELDISAIRSMLLKDGYQVISDFSEEYEVEVGKFFGRKAEEIRQLSDLLTEEHRFAEQMDALISDHRGMWMAKKDDVSFVDEARKATQNDLRAGSVYATSLACPACEQQAVVTLEPYYDSSDGEPYLSAVYPEHFHCNFCGLVLVGYEEFNYVDLDERLNIW